MKKLSAVILALTTALIGQASAISVSPPQTLDSPWTLQQGKFVDSQVAARDGYYYQIEGPAVAVDKSSGTILTAWEDWSENGKVVGKIGLRVLSANGTPGSVAYVTPDQGCVDFGPALASYDQGKFLLAVTEVPSDKLATQDYGKLLVYKINVSNGKIELTSPTSIADNSAYPYLVYVGSDNNGNKYVIVVYEHWNGTTGDVDLQVLKIDSSGNVGSVLSTPLTIAKNVCKDFVKNNVHYFGHARPVASVYEDNSGKHLVIVLTDYSQATPNVSNWGFFGEWLKCRVKAYVVDLPQDLSTLSPQNVHEVQGSLSGTTSECPWVCGNVVVYRVGSLWGGMSGNTTLPDINAALIVNSGGSWKFISDTTIYRRIWTQTSPSVTEVYKDNNGTPYYLAVFADNSGGFGKERIAGVLFRVKDGRIQVIAQYGLTGFGQNYYQYCPVVRTVQDEFGNAELVMAYYKGDTGYGGHRAGDVVASTVTVGCPMDEFMSSAADLLTNLTGTVDAINNAIFNGYSGLEKRVSTLEKDVKNLQKEVSNLESSVKELKNNVSNLTQTVSSVKNAQANLTNEVEKLKEDINRTSQSVSSLEKDVSEMKKDVESLHNEVKNIQSAMKKPKREKVPASPIVALLTVATLAARRKYR